MTEPKYQRPELDDLFDLGQKRMNELDAVEDVLPGCGCGRPADVLHLYARIMAFVAEGKGDWWTAVPAMISEDPEAAAYALIYVLDDRDLLEHGSSVPGWLTDKGKAWLAAYRKLAKEFPERDGS
jgi:hypothetical protein